MSFLKKILINLILIFLFFSISARAETKVYFIDIDYLIKHSDLGKKILLELENLKNNNVELIRKDENELKKIDDEINKTRNVLNKEELDIKIQNFKNKINLYENKKKSLNDNFSTTRLNMLNDFMNKVSPIIQKYMDDNSITVLLDKKNIFIGDSNYDITENIIIMVNKN